MSLSTFISSSRNIMRGDAGVDGDAQRIAQLTWMLFLKVYDAKEANWEIMLDDYESIIPERLRWRSWAPDHKDGRSMTGDELLIFLNEDLFPTLKTLPITENTPLSQTIVKGVFEDSNQYMKDGILIRQLVNLINEINFDDYADLHAFGEIYETLLKELQSAGSSGEYYTPRAVTDFMIKMLNPKLGERVADFAAGTSGFLTSALKHLDTQVESVEDREKFQNAVFGIEKKPMPYLLGVTNLLLHDVDEPAFFHGNSLSRNVREYKEHEKFEVIAMNPPYGGTEQEAVKANFRKPFDPPKLPTFSSRSLPTDSRRTAEQAWCCQTDFSLVATARSWLSRSDLSKNSTCTRSSDYQVQCSRRTPPSRPTCCSLTRLTPRRTCGSIG